MRKIYLLLIICLACLAIPSTKVEALTNHHDYYPHGWLKPNLYGAKKISDMMIDFDPAVEGEEVRREEFILADDAGRALRLSHNGRVFCYVADHDLLEPWDYQIVDYDGSGAFEQKEPPFSDFPLPRWTFINYPFPYLTGRRVADLTGIGDPTVKQMIDALSPREAPCIDMYTPEERAALTIARGGTPPPEKCAPNSGQYAAGGGPYDPYGGPRGSDPADGPPRMALNILFDFDKDTLTSHARGVLNTLGRALTSPTLAGGTFRIEGHTDAVGSYEYNMDLSRRRARTVQRYLMEHFNLQSSQLITDGLGLTMPLPNIDPEDGRNRRVEIVNLSAGSTRMTIQRREYQNLPAKPRGQN